MAAKDPSARSAAAHGIGIAHPTVVPENHGDVEECPECGTPVDES